MFRHFMLLASVISVLAACTQGNTLTPATPDSGPQQLSTMLQTAVAAPCVPSSTAPLQVAPTSLLLGSAFGRGTFTACSLHAGSYSISSSPSGIVSVPASATPSADPTTGKFRASLTVTAIIAGNSVITVADALGNRATVSVAVRSSRIFISNGGGLGHFPVTVYNELGVAISAPGGFPNINGPRGLVFDPFNNLLYVTNVLTYLSPTIAPVTVYDARGYQVRTSGTFPGLDKPKSISFDSLKRHLFVGTESGVHVFDEQGNPVLTPGGFPNSGAVHSLFDGCNRRLYLLSDGGGSTGNHVHVYDENGYPVSTTGSFPRPIGQYGGIALNPYSHRLFIAYFAPSTTGVGIRVYDENGNLVQTNGTFPHSENAIAIAFNNYNGLLYVLNAPPISTELRTRIYDTSGNEIAFPAGSFPGANGPVGIAWTP